MKNIIHVTALLLCLCVIASCGDSDDEIRSRPSGIEVCVIMGADGTQSRPQAFQTFSGNDIDWFCESPRELRLKSRSVNLANLPFNTMIEFRLNGNSLFTARLHQQVDSSSSFDLTLACGNGPGQYFLYDCYPEEQYKDEEEVIRHKKERAPQWETFIRALEREKRLRR